ncbi:hypothetical protein DPMN_135862 [Dreissena polymorpha]|uniref:Uncharacterized protein n=1 Tax=Dreissena polymorpha TaxID=45954 RepID=A0A9D4FYX3_DREPO|nr:hypothetical protein DPMN_135862 [Dreissena polymorpha]
MYTNLLTKFHKDWKYMWPLEKYAPSPRGHVLQATETIFELVQYIIGIHLLAKFHEDGQLLWPLESKNAPPLGIHVFQANVTICKHILDIMTKFHVELTINVASIALTRQMLTPHNGRRTTDKRRSHKLTISTFLRR